MREIERIPFNGFNVVSTFSGGGGSCLGWRMAGFKVIWANEVVPITRETYRANHPDTILDGRDIRQVKGAEILERTGLKEIDVLEGSPPCMSFSTAGVREKGWGKVGAHADGTRQRSDDLFFEYARLVRELQPKVFIAENVRGLILGAAKGYFLDILEAFRADSRYAIECRKLDAQWLGVPQHRERIIFMGIRSDLEKPPIFPAPLPYRYYLNEVLPHISRILLTQGNDDWQSAIGRPANTISATIMDHPHGRFGCQFIETAARERRRYSIDEIKRLATFPADYILHGKEAEQWARVGNCVPPFMMRAIAETVRDKILQ